MGLTRGQMGATQLLAQLLASIPDPHGDGVGGDIREIPNGVEIEVTMPTGDLYRVAVEWLGDREGLATGG